MSKNTKTAVEQRQKELILYLSKNHHATLEELSDQLKVSSATIRRDINTLVEDQTILRDRSGVITLNDVVALDPSVFKRRSAHYMQKVAIAKCALQYVHDDAVVGLNSSSTVLELVKLLPQLKAITVVTNSLLIASSLVSKSNITLYNVGGRVSLQGLASIGSATCEEIRRFSFDIAFSSASALDFEFGLSVTDPQYAETEAAFLHQAKRRIVLLDSSKIGKRVTRQFCPLSDIDMVITDSFITSEQIEQFHKIGVPLQIADVSLAFD